MNILQLDLADKKQVRDFLDLPFRIYRDIPQWVPPLRMDERPVGFLFAYPDVSAALQRTKGRLFPFGWLTMLLELRTPTGSTSTARGWSRNIAACRILGLISTRCTGRM